MGLSWINPLYLTGLLLLALPVLIHLMQRQHDRGMKFPSLMFLRQIQWREKRRLEIRHWLLLLLRCLLLLLIVIAFARPFLPGTMTVDAFDRERTDSVILIDRSYSMRIADRWQQAQRSALQLVGAKTAQDRIGIVMFDDEAEVVSDLSDNTANLRTVINRQSPGRETTRLRVAIEQAARLLSGSNARLKQIRLISDFQTTPAAIGGVAIIDRDIELVADAVEISASANTTIDSVSILPSAPAGGDSFALEVQLTNQADIPLTQRLALSLNGRELQARELQLPPRATIKEIYRGLRPGAGLARGIVSLEDDDLALDNRAYFVYSSQQRVPVLVVEPEQPRANQGFYLENALLLSRSPAFHVERRAWNAVQASELSQWAVIIVNDATMPGAALGSALRDFVAAGGGLLVALGEQNQGHWGSAENGYLPGKPRRRIDAKVGQSFRVTAFDNGLGMASRPDALLDLSASSVFSYRDLSPDQNDRVLASFDNGGIALAERRIGQGKALVLTTTLDPHWNDFAVQPVFLPFLHQTLRYLANWDSYPREFEVGENVYLLRYARGLAGNDALVAGAGDAPLIVEKPSGDITRVARDAALLHLDEAGFYQVHRATPADVEVVLAANIDPAEANPQTLDVAAFVEEIRSSSVTAKPPMLGRRKAIDEEQQQQLWQLVLLAALALMLVEALMANRLSTKQTLRSGIES